MRSLLVVPLALAALLPATASAQAPPPEREPTTLSVTGTGTVRVKPDTATIDIEVRRVGVAQEGPRASVNRRTTQIVAAVTRLGVARADIQTSGISLTQLRLRPAKKGGRARIRYIAANRVTVRTGVLEVVGRIFDVATRAGATDFAGPDYEVSNRTPARADATGVAVRDARRRADAAAAALGLRVVGVRSVTLDPGSGGGSSDQEVQPTESAGGRAQPPTPTSPGLEPVTATVSVAFVLDD